MLQFIRHAHPLTQDAANSTGKIPARFRQDSGNKIGNNSGKIGKLLNTSRLPSSPNFSSPVKIRHIAGNKIGKIPATIPARFSATSPAHADIVATGRCGAAACTRPTRHQVIYYSAILKGADRCVARSPYGTHRRGVRRGSSPPRSLLGTRSFVPGA